jgi:hypothetical protein
MSDSELHKEQAEMTRIQAFAIDDPKVKAACEVIAEYHEQQATKNYSS